MSQQSRTDEAPGWSCRRLTVEELASRLERKAGHESEGIAAPARRRGPLTDFDRDEQEARMRSPMQIPASWQSPFLPRRHSWLQRQLRSAAMGLLLGLAVALPVVAVVKTNPDASLALARIAANLGLARAATIGPAETRPAEPAPARTAATGRSQPSGEAPMRPLIQSPALVREVALPAPAAAPSAAPSATDHSVVQLAVARRLIKDGDVVAARALLMSATLADKPAAMFLLAETFDPMTLAAWDARGVSAEVPRAIALYEAALEKGIEEARLRLRLLRPN